MKVSKKIIHGFVSFLFIVNISFSTHNISAAVPPSLPDQFIAELFLNDTLPLQLINTKTIITFNATNFPNEIDIQFEANYTVYNPENSTTISLIVPFSLAINLSQSVIIVYENDTQIPFSLLTITPWNNNVTAIDISLPRFIERYPITLIRTNLTLINNSLSIIRYFIKGTIINPLEFTDPFYMIYHIGTSQDWLGNTTGRVDFKAYGKQPVFSRGGTLCSLDLDCCNHININGGTAFICKWFNSQIPNGDIGISYYGPSDDTFIIILVINLLIYTAIGFIIILIVLIRKNRKKIRSV